MLAGIGAGSFPSAVTADLSQNGHLTDAEFAHPSRPLARTVWVSTYEIPYRERGGELGGDDMTNGEPPEEPDGEETEGIEQPSIPGFRLPERPPPPPPPPPGPPEPPPAGEPQAVLFVPEGMDVDDPLNLRVWTVNGTTMRLIIARRC